MKTIIKTVIFITLLFVVYSCSQTKYFVRSVSDISSIDWQRNSLNFIPVQTKHLKTSVVLDSTYNLIVSGKLAKANRYLNKLKGNTNDYYLARTLCLISSNKYDEAIVSYRKMNEDNYPVIKQLLGVDLKYELLKSKGYTDYNDILNNYQELVDKYPDNEILKRIVSLRIRYMRYNY